jgi:hypothetical protein
MVTRERRSRTNAGRVSLSGLLTLLVVVVLVYYGLPAVTAYFRYWRMQVEMKEQARQSPGLTDDVIRRRLTIRAAELNLPPEAHRFVIQRRTRPREMVITTSWQVPLELPFTTYIWIARPEARAPL